MRESVFLFSSKHLLWLGHPQYQGFEANLLFFLFFSPLFPSPKHAKSLGSQKVTFFSCPRAQNIWQKLLIVIADFAILLSFFLLSFVVCKTAFTHSCTVDCM